MAQALATDRLKGGGHATVGVLRSDARQPAREDQSRHALQVHATLAAAVLEGATPLAVAARYSEMTGLPVVFCGPELKVVEGPRPVAGPHLARPATPAPGGPGDPRRVRIISRAVGSAVKRSYVAPVLVPSGLFGYLVLDEDRAVAIDDDIAMSSLQQAATLCALAVVRQRGGVELSNQLRRDLIASLLLRRDGNSAEASRLMELSGIVRGTVYRVLCVQIAPQRTDGSRRETQLAMVLQTLASEIGSRSPRSVSAIGDLELTSLVPECAMDSGGASAAALVRDAVGRTLAMFPAIRVAAGLGRGYAAPSGLADSFGEARNALHVRQRLSPASGLFSYEDLGVYSLIYQIADTSELTGFVDRVLGAMLAYDRKRQTDLVATLRAILENNGSMLNAARALGVHVNTVAYRSQRIQTISGLDLANSEDRLKAHLALKILDGLSPAERDAISVPVWLARAL